MKILFFIFALLLVFGHESFSRSEIHSVTYSPANPVEMWPIDCDTYNEEQICGVFQKCFCQPFNCSDIINLQISDIEGGDFVLRVESESGDTIEDIDFIKDEDISGNLMPALDEFENDNETTGTSWNLAVQPPAVSLNGISSSKNLHKIRSIRAGVYTLDYTVTFATNNAIFLRFYKDGELIESLTLTPFLGSSPHTDTIEFTLPDDADEIVFYTIRGAPGSGTSRINAAEMRLSTYSYQASFVPEEIGVCNDKIRLKIVNTTSSPEVEEMKSDCLDIQESHACTNLIEYSNHKNISGLVYQNVSPAPVFYLRVPSVFFHERFPSEQFAIELTSGYGKLNGVVKAQRKFETDYLPYYFHQRMNVILLHSSILIAGYYWTQEEGYEISEGGNKWPVKMGYVYLTKRDFVQRT